MNKFVKEKDLNFDEVGYVSCVTEDHSVFNVKPSTSDLFSFSCVAITEGVNKNDMFFDLDEMNMSVSTGCDKPVNIEHDPTSIIGHSIATLICKEEETALHHILTECVIYTKFPDNKRLQDTVNDLVKKIKNREIFVSVECLYDNFDYLLIDENGNNEVIERNEDTAHLSKFLKRFKGPGSIDNKKIYMKIKNFVICGLGLVQNPANVHSIILSTDGVISNKEGKIMEMEEEVGIANVEPVLETASEDTSVETVESTIEELDSSMQVDMVDENLANVTQELVTVREALLATTQELEQFKSRCSELVAKNMQFTRSFKALEAGLPLDQCLQLGNLECTDETFDKMLEFYSNFLKSSAIGISSTRPLLYGKPSVESSKIENSIEQFTESLQVMKNSTVPTLVSGVKDNVVDNATKLAEAFKHYNNKKGNK